MICCFMVYVFAIPGLFLGEFHIWSTVPYISVQSKVTRQHYLKYLINMPLCRNPKHTAVEKEEPCRSSHELCDEKAA